MISAGETWKIFFSNDPAAQRGLSEKKIFSKSHQLKPVEDSMTLKIAALIFGAFFILAGIAGFIPALAPDHLLFGLFMVDPIHNCIHLLSGIFALIGAIKVPWAIMYFKVFGVIYGLVTILGFITEDLILIHVNLADNLLHLAISLVALYFGFFYQPRPPVRVGDNEKFTGR